VTPDRAALREKNPDCVRHFSHVEPEAFSGVTVFSGQRRMIVYNDAHVPGRQHSDVAHELAHALLMHPPAPGRWLSARAPAR
jgi:Zn-dependent peptidase ImmA (M78 family)